tara:strand:+ start:8168 stop:8338 length:171 start_codon:yes stop_codon:yes gene_type:complete
MIMENTQIDLSNYEVADLNEIRRKAALMQAEEMSRLMAAFSKSVKNLFTFGSLRHA